MKTHCSEWNLANTGSYPWTPPEAFRKIRVKTCFKQRELRKWRKARVQLGVWVLQHSSDSLPSLLNALIYLLLYDSVGFITDWSSRQQRFKSDTFKTKRTLLTKTFAFFTEETLRCLTDRSIESYLEWARLEAGLADGDRTLPGEEYGEREEVTAWICPEDDKQLLLFSEGDLRDKKQGLKHSRAMM